MQAFFENFFDIFKKILRIYKIELYERDKIMKFKTVVITKKKLIIAVVGILFLGGIITAVSLIPPKTANVFNYQNEIYEDILAEGLPNNNEKTFSLKDFAKKILGFDIENPETIISDIHRYLTGQPHRRSRRIQVKKLRKTVRSREKNKRRKHLTQYRKK